MNPTQIEEENMEDLLRGVYERIKEHKSKDKERKVKPRPYQENSYPFVPGDGEVLIAVLNSDGVWEVPNR